MKYQKILWFSDGQVKPGVKVNHFAALGHMAASHKPDVIVCGGDHWDLPSLSSYEQGTVDAEGQRLRLDLDSGAEAMELFEKPIIKRGGYNPRMIYLEGNHEYRLQRMMNRKPWMADLFGNEEVFLMSKKWEQHKFLEVVSIAGIAFSHYFRAQGSDRPIGGSIQNRLNKIGASFVQGHQQAMSYERRTLPTGGSISGLVCGAFYQHNEKYLGPQMDSHFRGACMLHGAAKGDYDLEMWSVKRLLREYG